MGNIDKLYGEVEMNVNIEDIGKPTGFATDMAQNFFANFKNPLTGNNRIFTKEDLNSMTPDEFLNSENEIMAQIKMMKGVIPTNEDLHNKMTTSGEVVYVNSYTRSDGTNVKGYYRSKASF